MVFVLFRPALPALRAQSIQIVNSAHALARRGTRVVLCFEPTGGDPLRPYGLSPHPLLTMVRLPRRRTPASVAFRAHVLRAARRGARFLARSKRYAQQLLRWVPSAHVVLEAHEVDSLQTTGAEARRFFDLEAEVLAGVRAVVCNCEGVSHGLRRQHAPLPPLTVVHNAAAPVPFSRESASQGIGLAGSLIPGKDLETVARAAPWVGGIHWMGRAAPERVAHLRHLSEGFFRPVGPVSPASLGLRLQQFRTLLLPLGRGVFGQEFTSPLKAFSYTAARVPIVGANTPALNRAIPGAFHPYEPGNVESLVCALKAVQGNDGLRDRLRAHMRPRTWDDRAREMESVLGL